MPSAPSCCVCAASSRRRRPSSARLEGTVAADQRVLAQQLVGSYEGARPDIVDVVLEATGFNDLLERLAFAQQIGRQDARIVGNVKAARRAVSAEAIRLGALSARANQLAEQALTDRNQVATLRFRLVSQRLAAAKAAAAKAGQLASAKAQVTSLTNQLAKLQAAQRAAARRRARRGPAVVERRARRAGSGGQGSSGAGGTPHGPVSHGFEFPMPKGDVSPPATWSLDDGVDIAAPGGTPELAVCSGTIVQHGIGGFGPSAPVLHCDSPLAGYDYVYYGHAGPGNWTPIGTHVEPGPGHLPGRVRDRRHLLGSPPGDRVRRLQRLADRALQRAGDDVAAALRLRGLIRAAGPASGRSRRGCEPRHHRLRGVDELGRAQHLHRRVHQAIHTRNSCDHDPRVLTMHASSPSGSTVA